MWVAHYLKDGNHPFHQDKKQYKYRWIISLGCMGKQFWFKCGDKEVGFNLYHSSVMIMTQKAGGVVGSLMHGAYNCEGSWVVGMETKEA